MSSMETIRNVGHNRAVATSAAILFGATMLAGCKGSDQNTAPNNPVGTQSQPGSNNSTDTTPSSLNGCDNSALNADFQQLAGGVQGACTYNVYPAGDGKSTGYIALWQGGTKQMRVSFGDFQSPDIIAAKDKSLQDMLTQETGSNNVTLVDTNLGKLDCFIAKDIVAEQSDDCAVKGTSYWLQVVLANMESNGPPIPYDANLTNKIISDAVNGAFGSNG